MEHTHSEVKPVVVAFYCSVYFFEPVKDPESCLEESKSVHPDQVSNNAKSFSKTTKGYVKTHTQK